MKNKHKRIPEDLALLRIIQEQVSRNLIINESLVRKRLLLKFVFYGTLAILLYSGIYLISDPLLFVIDFILFGLVSVLLGFNFAHDLSHGTIFKKKSWNSNSFIALYTLVGAHAEAWRFRHINSHHYAPNVEHYDTDLQISSLIRVVPGSAYKWYHRFQHLYAPFAYTTYSLYWITIKDFVVFVTDKNKSAGYFLSFVAQKIFYATYLVLLPILFSGQGWLLVCLAFLSMHLVQSLFLLFTFFITHHVEETSYHFTDENGIIDTSWLMNQVKSSNDFYPFSRFANFIFGGFNNHVAHHLFPSVNHIHYPELNKILYRELEKNNIRPNQTTYFGGIRSHLRLLRSMGIDSLKLHWKLSI